MKERSEVIKFCEQLKDVYEDEPFHDPNWMIMRHKENKKVFAWIFEREGYVWVNVKCDPEWREFWRNAYQSVVPAFHLNKKYWNSVILDESIPTKEIERMILESYDLTKPTKKEK